jgi:serine/threonine protein phosphatase PrpC
VSGERSTDRARHELEDGAAAFELWKSAIEAGGPDNITLAVIRLALQRPTRRFSSA